MSGYLNTNEWRNVFTQLCFAVSWAYWNSSGIGFENGEALFVCAVRVWMSLKSLFNVEPDIDWKLVEWTWWWWGGEWEKDGTDWGLIIGWWRRLIIGCGVETVLLLVSEGSSGEDKHRKREDLGRSFALNAWVVFAAKLIEARCWFCCWEGADSWSFLSSSLLISISSSLSLSFSLSMVVHLLIFLHHGKIDLMMWSWFALKIQSAGFDQRLVLRWSFLLRNFALGRTLFFNNRMLNE